MQNQQGNNNRKEKIAKHKTRLNQNTVQTLSIKSREQKKIILLGRWEESKKYFQRA